MKAYKGFNRDMTCRGFQYEEGKEYETDKAKCCDTGFHACENPIDCLGYYVPGTSVYHEVELDGEIDRQHDGDTKVAATKIKIGARLDIPALCHAAFEYVRSECTNENNAEAGKPATAGYKGAATAGYKIMEHQFIAAYEITQRIKCDATTVFESALIIIGTGRTE